MRHLFTAILSVCILTIPAFADYIEERNLEVSADDINMLRIDCGAGFLEIEGVDGMETIEVEAEIILDMRDKKAKEFMEDYMDLELRTQGSSARLTSNFDNPGFFSNIFRSNKNMLINLTVKIPRDIELRIDDGSGYIIIENVGDDITVDDGSGEITFIGIEGDLRIDDGSGDVDMEDIVGDIEIDDGSGNVDIANVTGDIEIDDGSGNIYVERVDGTVIVDDGSGNIKINHVSEDVKIIDEGSGHCSITNVDGDIDR
jgi:hypothetical protein